MLEKKVGNQKRQLSVFYSSAKPGTDDKELDGSEKEDGNRKNSYFTCQGTYKRPKKAWHRTP